MRFAVTGICTALTVCLLLGSGTFQAGEKEKPKYNIKEVMKQAHVGAEKSLLAKVANGTATRDDQAKLVALYVALSENTPPKGSAEAWKMRTGKMVELARKAEKGDEAAAKALAKAAACMACHQMHKAPSKGR